MSVHSIPIDSLSRYKQSLEQFNLQDCDFLTKESFSKLFEARKEKDIPFAIGIAQTQVHRHAFSATSWVAYLEANNQNPLRTVAVEKIHWFVISNFLHPKFEHMFETNKTEMNNLILELGKLSDPNPAQVAKSMLLIGYCYQKGHILCRSLHKAIIWFGHAARLGNEAAKNEIELMGMYPQTLEDIHRFVQYHLKHGNIEVLHKTDFSEIQPSENPMAQNLLGEFYWHGIGVEQSYEEGAKWYLKSAQQGFAPAQKNIGLCYMTGKGVRKNHRQAINWMQKARDGGSEEAKFYLRFLVDLGKDLPSTLEEKIQMYQHASKEWYNEMILELGLQFLHGDNIEQCTDDGIFWLIEASENGYLKASITLGRIYSGNIEVKDVFIYATKQEAYEWCQIAAKHDVPEAHCYVGKHNLENRNFVEGVHHYVKALQLGSKEAKDFLEGFYLENHLRHYETVGEMIQDFSRLRDEGKISDVEYAVLSRTRTGCTIM